MDFDTLMSDAYEMLHGDFFYLYDLIRLRH